MADHPSTNAERQHDERHTMRVRAVLDDESYLTCDQCAREVSIFRSDGRYLVLAAGDHRIMHQSILAT
jgi:arginase family enzyme